MAPTYSTPFSFSGPIVVPPSSLTTQLGDWEAQALAAGWRPPRRRLRDLLRRR